MNKKEILGLLTLFILFVSLGTAYAFNGVFRNLENQDDIKSYLESGDYESWKNEIISQLTKENFEKFVERHNQMKKGNFDMENVRLAIEEEDYESYLKTITNLETNEKNEGRFATLSEEEFKVLVEAHKAMQNGDFETARNLKESLGFGKGFLKEGFEKSSRNQRKECISG